MLARSDSAGATHAFAAACVARGVEFSFGFPIDARIRRVVDLIPGTTAGTRRSRATSDLRDGAWVFEATGMIDLRGWPAGSRLILRKERPHPGAQLTFTDLDGHRITAVLTNTARRGGPRAGRRPGAAPPPARPGRGPDPGGQGHRAAQPALPWLHRLNAAWLEVVLTAVDLVTWTQLIGFADAPVLARCEIHAFRYRVLHVAARITRGARRTHLRLDQRWRWATQIAEGFHRIRAAFA